MPSLPGNVSRQARVFAFSNLKCRWDYKLLFIRPPDMIEIKFENIAGPMA